MTNAVEANDGRAVTRGLGVPGKLAVSWAAAGGVLVGGFLVATMTLMGQLSGHGLLVTSTGLFLVGALLGFIHGGVLGWMGRPAEMTRGSAVASLAMGVAYAVPALLACWLVAGWIGMTSVALYAGKAAPIIGCGVAWLAGLALVSAAGAGGWRALRSAYEGWSNARIGTVLVAALFGGLLAAFLSEQPEIWGLQLRVTPVGAVLLALAATVWLAGPLVTVSLGLLDRMPSPCPAKAFGGRGQALASIAIAVLVGVGMALIAMPFYRSAYGIGTSSMASVLSTALLDEVLLRLFLVTAVAWVLLRQFDMKAGGAAIVAVGIAALVQTLVYLPGVLAIGFPSVTTAIGFTALTVLVPAIAFGVLFWRRGFGTALVAHATALGALLLMAGG